MHRYTSKRAYTLWRGCASGWSDIDSDGRSPTVLSDSIKAVEGDECPPFPMSNVQTATNFVLRELDIFFAFSWRDWSASIIPGLLFSTSAARASGLPAIILLSRYILLIVWITFYIYSFNLNNQIFGIAADQIDKPDRPIPSGKVILRGAKLRWMFTTASFFLSSIFCPSVLPETIVWLLTTVFLNLTTAGNHWVGKNCIAMSVGAWSLCSASWKIITPATAQSTHYVHAFAVWASLATHIQDLRDMKGDAAMGRKTLPLVFGDVGSRRLLALIAIPLQGVVLWHAQITHIAPVLLGISHVFVAWRVLQAGRGSKYDHKTYMVGFVQRASVDRR